MSRPPRHLQRLAIQHGKHRIKQRSTSHAIPTDYAPVELTERTALRAMLGEFEVSHETMLGYWDHLAECRNVLMFGAGHMREQAKKRGENPRIYIDILTLCDQAKASMLSMKAHAEEFGKFALTDDEKTNLAGLVETSAEFWRIHPNWFFIECVDASLKMIERIRNEKEAA